MSRLQNELNREIVEGLSEFEERRRWKIEVKKRWPWLNPTDGDWHEFGDVPMDELSFMMMRGFDLFLARCSGIARIRENTSRTPNCG